MTGLRYPDKDISLDGAFDGLSYIGDTLQLEKKDSNYYVWCGNNNYTVSVVKRTKDSVEVFKLGEFSISMPSGFDYYIGHPLITGKRLEPFIFTTNGNVVNVTEDWLPNVLNSKGVFTSTEKEILKTQLTYQKGKDKQSITVGCINGTLPYTIETYGNGEKGTMFEGRGFFELHQFDSEANTISNGFSLDIDSFIMATQGVPKVLIDAPEGQPKYELLFKYPYLVSFADAETTIDTGVTYNYETINKGPYTVTYLDNNQPETGTTVGSDIEIALTLYIETTGPWNYVGMEEGTEKYEFKYAGYTAYLEVTSYKINGVVYALPEQPFTEKDYELDLQPLLRVYPNFDENIRFNVLFSGSNADIDNTSYELEGSIKNAKTQISTIDPPTAISLTRSFNVKSCVWLPKFTNVKVVVNKQAKVCDYRNTLLIGPVKPSKAFRAQHSKNVEITIKDSDDPKAEKLSLESSSTTFVQEQGKKYIPLHCLKRSN